MKKQILAVQIIGDKIVAFKTEDKSSITKADLLIDISLNTTEYYIIINNQKYDFKIDENGEISEPSFDLFVQAKTF